VNKSLFFILIVIVAFNSNAVQASSDLDCPPPLTALISNNMVLQCSSGIGNAILNPYNDSRVNLLLAMIRPVKNQTVENSNVLYWDVTSNPIKSPFYIQTFQLTGRTDDEQYAYYSRFVELLRGLGLNEDNLILNLDRINKNYIAPSLSPLACRALDFYNNIKSDALLSARDRKQIMSYLLQLDNTPATANTKDYLGYISAANAFYTDDYEAAGKIFSQLTNTGSAWVKEASLYNLIRVEIRKTQQQSDDRYGFFDIAGVDKTQANKIIPAIQRYLDKYPAGRYADSADQLKRRAYWLTHDWKKLVESYLKAINAVRNNNNFITATELSLEIDDKYLSANMENNANKIHAPLEQIVWDDPVIATAQILIRLRKPASAVGLDVIKLHENNFERQKANSLYQYILTAYNFFGEEKYEAVVKETENWRTNITQADYASFSIAALRAEALSKLNRWQDAAVLLQELRELSPSPLLKDHFELAQAQNLEASGNLKKIFEPDSIIHSPILRKRILRAAADTRLLEYVLDQKHIITSEKSIALAALLNKELLSKQYKSLLEHQQKYATLKLDNVDGLDLLRNETISSKDNFTCQKWSKVLADLNSDKVPPQALLCLGERLRTLEDSFIKPLVPYKDELGKSDDNFNCKSLTRLPLYLAVIDNDSAKDDDKAFALRRALYCFATSGYNHCGTEEIPAEKRKDWFIKLKSEYKKSPWSIKQKYYW
jgi:hypothetical protein